MRVALILIEIGADVSDVVFYLIIMCLLESLQVSTICSRVALLICIVARAGVGKRGTEPAAIGVEWKISFLDVVSHR